MLRWDFQYCNTCNGGADQIQGIAGARISSSDESDIIVVKNFESQVFSGASIQTNTHNTDSLQRLEGVLRVWPNNLISLAPLEPASFSDAAAASKYTTHNATGVSKLHERGIYGQGVKVGVVDTGSWYDHPAVSFSLGISFTKLNWKQLGGGYGEGFKIVGGYDFVGDGSKLWSMISATENMNRLHWCVCAVWPAEPKTPDDDPLDLQGHGEILKNHFTWLQLYLTML